MEQFNNASLIGNYAVADTGIGGQTPQAGVVDHVRRQRLVFWRNHPRWLKHVQGAGVFVRAPFAGTYSVSESGDRRRTISTTMADGSKQQVRTALVITKSAKQEWRDRSGRIRPSCTSSWDHRRQIF